MGLLGREKALRGRKSHKPGAAEAGCRGAEEMQSKGNKP